MFSQVGDGPCVHVFFFLPATKAGGGAHYQHIIAKPQYTCINHLKSRFLFFYQTFLSELSTRKLLEFIFKHDLHLL